MLTQKLSLVRIFEDLFVLMCSEPVDLVKGDVHVIDIVVSDIDVNVDELERKLGEGFLTQSGVTGLITTLDKKVDQV